LRSPSRRSPHAASSSPQPTSTCERRTRLGLLAFFFDFLVFFGLKTKLYKSPSPPDGLVVLHLAEGSLLVLQTLGPFCRIEMLPSLVTRNENDKHLWWGGGEVERDCKEREITSSRLPSMWVARDFLGSMPNLSKWAFSSGVILEVSGCGCGKHAILVNLMFASLYRRCIHT
jgi:hypothetical protein